MTRIKICGVCRPEDARFTVERGVHAIGMVLAPGIERSVSIEAALRIAAVVSPFTSLVGLFVDPGENEIAEALRHLPLAAIQLHGHETPEMVAALKPHRVIKALRVGRGDEALLRSWTEAIADLELTNLAGIVLETAKSDGAAGGTGIANDWDALCEMKEHGAFDGLPALVAAGGLRAETVGDVIRRFRPYAVDVSSGVELAKREKSPKKMAAFVDAVLTADRS
jgi:phosphoribosylanthranilate isomerase